MRPDIKTDSMVVLIALAILLGMTGCAPVGPDYAAPGIAVPGDWQTTSGGSSQPESPTPSRLECWWSQLNDPILSHLIDLALAQNLDVKAALARVREARARYRIRDAALFPTLDLSADATQSRNGTHAVQESYSTFMDAGWELDLFGGVRRAREAAAAEVQAETADLSDALVSLTAEVGLNYVDLRTYQTRLAVARANLETQQQTYELVQGRYRVGLSNETTLQQARYNLESTRSRIPTLITDGAAALNQLTVLTGQTPGRLHGMLDVPHPVPVAPVSIAVGIPAQALQRRPDIRRVERLLAAETARIGVAEAERYPKIRLSGSIGLEAGKLADLFESEALFWKHGPGIAWTIFDAGAIRFGIKAQEAVQEQALIAYQTAVLEALAEVENAITAFAQEQLRRKRLTQAVEAAQVAEKFSRDQFSAGLTGFSDVLEVQRTLLSFQDQLAESDGTVTANLIRLYKALGGGWSPSMLDEGTLSP